MADIAGMLTDPDYWDMIANKIGTHDYIYDLSDASERLDIVQIVCQAAAKVLGPRS